MASRLATKFAFSFAVGAAAGVVIGWWYGLFWQHALIVGIAIAALTYVTIGTVERLRGLYRR